jgi:hypothetical protein
MVVEKAIFEEGDGKKGGGESSDTGGAAAMLKETLIDESAKHWNPIQNGMVHFSVSKWKIVSVEHSNRRAKINASSRLGT